jgi:hypothetical protein
VLECPIALYKKLQSGLYELNPDNLHHQLDNYVSEDISMVELLIDMSD